MNFFILDFKFLDYFSFSFFLFRVIAQMVSMSQVYVFLCLIYSASLFIKEVTVFVFQRVKVYRLNDDGKWDDQGTGHVSVDYMEVCP